MGSAICLRSDFDRDGLRLLARQTKDAGQTRRLLALASIYDGGTRADAARLSSVTVQIVRDWVARFNARGPDGLINGKAPGKPSLLNDDQRAALAQALERGPTPYVDGVVRWRLCDLAQWLWEEFRISVSEQTLGREVRSMGYRTSSRLARDIMRRTLMRSWFLKKLPQCCGRGRRRSRQGQSDRNLVPGRGTCWAEEQDHSPLGQARIKAICTARPAHPLGLHLRRDMPQTRQGRSPRHALVRYACYEPACDRNLPERRRRCACHLDHGSGTLAHVQQLGCPRKHHHPAPAAEITRTQSR